MTCGYISPISTPLSFKKLAVLLEGNTTSGAEQACRKTMDYLVYQKAENGIIHMV